jgi:hypothetical protein
MDFIEYHSNWGLAVLLLILIAIVSSIIGVISKKSFGIMDRKFSLYALIAVHIQILFGVVSYMQSQITLSAMQDFGGAMKDASIRLFAVEHPLMMFIGAILITIGFSKAKNANEDKVKFKKILIFYSIGLLFILSRIPWSQWGQH